MWIRAAAIIGLVGLGGGLPSASATGTPANRHPAQNSIPVIVELFTSEGCSSCPPADTLLIELIREQPVKGATVIGLSEHVDYWDRQGWKDPFSDRLFTQRQSAYARLAGGNDIYTPQIIVDGVDLVIGHDRPAVLAAIRRAAGREKRPVTLEWSADVSRLSVAVERSPRTVNSTVFLAITEDGLRTSVKRGENSGRTLNHTAVARRLIQIGKTDKDGGFEGVVPVPIASAWNRPNVRVVVFVQNDKSGRIEAASTIGP